MKKFLHELQRRNVIKAAISYVVFAWVLIQAASILYPVIGWGQGAIRITLIGLIAGFPIWLVFAYVFEWTTQGFKKTTEIAEETSIGKATNKRLNGVIIAGMALAIVLLVTDRIFSFSKLADTTQPKSIAVMPFENMSSEDDLYFTKGITEDILTQISKIEDLRVLSNFTLKDYDSKGKTLEQIGEELGVSYVLTGSVRRADQQLRITAQLVQVRPEEQVWADNFDKTMEDVFAIQSQVALEVGQSLQINLSPKQTENISRQPTTNTLAYNYYLKGREQYNNYTPAGMKNAMDYFKKATRLDPSFALAWAGLTDVYLQGSYPNYGLFPIAYQDSAMVTGQRALRLDNMVPETWKALGFVYHVKGNIVEAERHYKKALEVNPNHGPALGNLAVILMNQKKYNEALVLQQRIIEHNPFNVTVGKNVSEIYWKQGKYGKALHYLHQMEERMPLTNSIYESFAYHYYELEMFDESLEAFRRFYDNDLNNSALVEKEANHYAVNTPKETKAKQLIEKLYASGPKSAYINGACADVVLQFGDVALGALYLQRALACEDYDSNLDYSVPLNMGYVLWQQGKQKEATVWLDQSLAWAQKEFQKNQGFYSLSMVAHNYAIRGKTNEALDWLEKAIAAGYKDRVNLISDARLKNLHKEPRFIKMMADLEEATRVRREKALEYLKKNSK